MGRAPWRSTMRLRLATSFVFALVVTINPAMAAERACRPSLSNFYHCPDSNSPSAQPTTSPSSRTCHPSVSNFWTCPDNAPSKKTTSARACRPSLSNGYSCPEVLRFHLVPTMERRRRSRTKPLQQNVGVDRVCPTDTSVPVGRRRRQRPLPIQLQYSTERQARSHCPSDTVVSAEY